MKGDGHILQRVDFIRLVRRRLETLGREAFEQALGIGLGAGVQHADFQGARLAEVDRGEAVDPNHPYRPTSGEPGVDQGAEPLMERVEQALPSILACGLVEVLVAGHRIDFTALWNAVRRLEGRFRSISRRE